MIEWICFCVVLAGLSFVAGMATNRSFRSMDLYFMECELESLQAAHEVLMAELNEHRKINAELDYLKPSSELEKCQ